MLKRVSFVTINVEDQERALRFYTEKLGFRVFTDQPMGNSGRWIELELPGAQTRVTLFKGPVDNAAQTPALCLTADNAERTFEELKAKGVQFVQPVQKASWGTSAILVDSEGNWVLFSSR